MPIRPHSSSISPKRTRESYTLRACTACQQKKKKCEVVFDAQQGGRRDCEKCLASNTECVWTQKRPRISHNQVLVDSLRNRIKFLEEELARLKVDEDPDDSISSVTSHPDDPWTGSSTSHLEIRTVEEVNIDEIMMPSTNLVLNNEDDDLQHMGLCSIFRLAPCLPGRASRLPEIWDSSQQRYVLQVDGVDHTHCKSNFDWSRHLPREVFMDRREHDKLLNLLFKFFTSWCLRIVPPLFLRDMYRALSVPVSKTPPRTPHYSPMLHNALLALAMAFSDDPRIRDLNARQLYARKAKSYLEVECQRPSISLLHALSILASFHISQGDQNLGYIYFGMSSQISQVLGLNIDCSSWVKATRISHDDMLDRNWAYWSIFSQDLCWSFYVGRRGTIPSPSDHSHIPIPFVDSEYDQIPWHYPPSNIPPQPNYLSRTFAETCELLKIARQVMNFLNGLKRNASAQSVHEGLIRRIDDRLGTWKECLSPEVDITSADLGVALPHRLMLHLAYWWQYTLLHRPFYRRARGTPSSQSAADHIGICNDAAAKIMELLNAWRTSYTLRFVPVTVIQVVFSAGTIFLLATVQVGTGGATPSLAHLRSQAALCIQYLSEVGQSWNCANAVGAILENLRQVAERLLQQRLEKHQRDRTNSLSIQEHTFIGVSSQEVESLFPPPPGGLPLKAGYHYDLSFGPQPFTVDPLPDALTAGDSYDISGADSDEALRLEFGSGAVNPLIGLAEPTNLNRENAWQQPNPAQWQELVRSFWATVPPTDDYMTG